MLANLMPPPPRVVAPPPTDGPVELNPQFRNWLTRAGLRTADDFLALRGVIVGGHPDRHVVRVSLGNGRTAYLKREHLVPLPVRVRNAAAGFGFVSRSGREARVLQHLEAAGLPCPRWLAHGTAADGRAFLLIDELTDATDLRAAAGDNALPPDDLAAVGRALAAVHAAGVTTPDLSAKHVFLRGDDAPCFLDWANARIGRTITTADRAAGLAGLLATLPPDSAREALIHAYADAAGVERRPLTDAVDARLGRRRGKSSAREQRQSPAAPVEWSWLDGEAVCVRAELAELWPTPPADLFYRDGDEPGDPLTVRLPNGSATESHRFTHATVRPAVWERLTGRIWRSAGVRFARTAAHLERYGLPVARVVAFGQRRTERGGESFVAVEATAAAPLWAFLPTATPDQRRRVLFELGAWVRSAHAAACRVPPAAVRVTDTAVPRVLFDPLVVAKGNAVSPADAVADLRRLVAAVTGRTDRLRLLSGYVTGGKSPFALRDLARRLNVSRRAA